MRGATRSLITIGCILAFAQGANAADLPTKASVHKAPAEAAYHWNGFYIGANLGYGWSHTDSTNVNGNTPFPAGTQSSTDQDGILGGLQGGYNWQFAPNWLAGIEGDFSWANISGDSSSASPVAAFATTRLAQSDTKVNWLATVTGRLGYVMNNWLIYAKGGAAWAHKKISSTGVNPAAGNLLLTSVDGDVTRTGWTVGGGVEWGFAQDWSAKVEYDYLDFGTETESRNATYFNGANGASPLLRDVSWHISVIKFGVNYHFD